MRKKVLQTIGVLCSIAYLPLIALDLPKLNDIKDRIYFAYPVTEAPVIDGKLEKKFWGNIPRAKYFVVGNLETNSVTKPTMFQIAYDNQYLYIGATMWESAPDLIKSASTKQDGWPDTDRINFIFSKSYDRNGTYQDSPYLFVMFGAGGIHQAFRNILPDKSEKSLTEPEAWITAYSKDDKHWYLESRIPFSMLDFSPKDGEIFFNVRRDNKTGLYNECESMWSQGIVASQGAHCFGTLIFNKKPGNLYRDEFWLNRCPRYWYMTGVINPVGEKKGEYIGAKIQYGNLPGWDKADDASDKIAQFMKKHPETISDEVDDLYMEWQQRIRTLCLTAPAKEFQIKTRDARVISVNLNGYTVSPKNGKYQLAIYSGINALKITAEATGKSPGVKFELANSPETSTAFSASILGSEILNAVSVKDGYIWQGNAEKLVFHQNLIWNREYCNHPLQFITPNVKEWGVSPGETMFIIHRMFNPNKIGKCDYKLIAEIPEGFVRINDISYTCVYNHYWTKNVKTEKIDLNGKKYVRYTYQWDLPEKLTYGQKFYTHFISFRNDYHFKPGEKVEFRFWRVVNNNTIDMTNVIKVAPLPQIHGGKLTKVLFPQYDHFMGGRVSHEQWRGMVDDSCKAGLNSFKLGSAYPSWKGKTEGLEMLFVNQLLTRKDTRNFNWIRDQLPLWGAGREGYTRDLVDRTPELQAKYYNNTGSYTKGFYREFCLTNATGKYRKQFLQALIKDYCQMLRDAPCDYVFFNDENFPSLYNWRHSWCFCNVCKADFRKMFSIPESEDLSDGTIVTKYEAQWNRWWRHKHKDLLLQMAYEAVHKVGAKLFYYHQTHDTTAYEEARGKFDMVTFPLPGCASFCGSGKQESMDAAKRIGDKITGKYQSIGQFVTYTRRGAFFSSDSFYFYPKEVKQVLVRAAAVNHHGAFCESASLFSAGALYYAGEATRLIAAYEDLFFDGIRADNLAVSKTFKYPDMLVLKKASERLILIFNENHETAKSGIIKNLDLEPGQKAKIWGSNEVVLDPSSVPITVQAQDVAAIYIK